MKDRFSSVAKQYAQYRPEYPPQLYDFILQHVQQKDTAWDVGTGNGQVAGVLAAHFREVNATDISAQQLAHAVAKPNIIYSVQAAEETNFPAAQFDLITVAQAFHWFHFSKFFAEVDRTLKPGGLLAAWGYGLIETEGELNNNIKDFYKSIDEYWDAERRHVDDAYADIPFPYPLLEAPVFYIHASWTQPQLAGYLSTWSAVNKYIQKHDADPLQNFIDAFKANWGTAELRSFRFPIFLKMGRKISSTNSSQ